MVYMNYGDKNKFIIQTPMMSVPFGLSEFVSDNGGPIKYSIDCSFNGYSNDNKLMSFYELIKSLDELMIVKGVENSSIWFNKQMSTEVVENLYRPLITPAIRRMNKSDS